MSDSFGIKIGVEGEKAFKQSLREINDNFKVLGSEMKLATSNFDKNEKSIESLTATNKALENQIDAQKSKVQTLKSALDNASTSFGESDKRTKAWQVQLNNATADLNKMEREVSANEKAIEQLSLDMKDGADSADELADGIQNSGDVAESSKGKFEGFGSVLGGIGTAIGATVLAIGACAVKAGADLISLGDDYNKAVNNISASTGATGAELESLGKVAQNVYTNNFGDSLEDVANGLSEVKKITGLMDDELQKATESGFALRDTFGYDLQESARTANSLMKNFGVSSEEAYDIIATGAQNGADQNGDLLDTLNEYSAQYSALGLSADQFVNGLISGSEQGVFSIDKVGDAVKEFNIRAKDGSDSTIEAFTTLGMNADTMMSSFAKGGDEANKAFFEVVSALDSMEDPIAKNTTAVALFGTQYEDLESTVLPVLSSMQDGAIQTSGALDQINQIKYDNIDSALEGTSRSIQGVFLPAVSEMSSGITDAFSTLGNEINQADGDMSQISTAIGTALGDILNVIMEQLPMFIEMGLSIVTSICSAIVENLPLIIDGAVQIVMTLLTALIEALPQITEGALQLLMALVNGIIENLPLLVSVALQMVTSIITGIAQAIPTLIPTIVSLVVEIVNTLIANLPLILDAALQLITGLAQGLLNAIPVLIAALPEIINSLITFLLDAIPQIIETGITLLTSLVESLPTIITAIVKAIPQIIDGIINAVISAIPLIIDSGIKLLVSLIQALPTIIVTIVKAIPQIISSLVNAIVGNIDKIIMAGVQLFVSLIENLPTIIVEIVKAVPQIIGGIISAFGSLMYKITEIGGNIVKGLWSGITGLASWLWDKVSGWITSIWDGIMDFFGIHSPSKEMAWIGEMLVEGLAGSIDKDGKKAVNSATSMSKDIMDTMNSLGTEMQNVIPSDFNASVNGNITSSTGNLAKTGLSLVLNIQAFNNYSNEDIHSLTNEIMNTAGEFAKRKGVVFA